ncbi:MAG: transglycosylase SLT domain-containing protein [Francisella sp.]
MKRYLKVFSIMFLCILLLNCSEKVQIDHNKDICTILKENPDWKKTLIKVHEKYKVEPEFIMALIYQESRFDAKAKSKHSTAYGYAQVINKTWKHFQEDVKANAKRDNFDDSAEFVGWYVSQLANKLKIKMTDYSNLYMAYMLGATGFKRYKNGTFKNTEKIEKDKKITLKLKGYTKEYKSQLKQCPL